MASLAAHWVDRVLPDVGIRQWVVTVPTTMRKSTATMTTRCR